MPDIGYLAAKITASIAPGFFQAIDRANAAINKLGSSVGITDLTGIVGLTKQGDMTAAVFAKVQPLVAAAGVAMHFFVENISRTAEEIDRTAKAADRLGISTEAFAGLQHAADLAGTDIHTLGTALDRLNRELGDAASGSQQAQRNFRRLGLDAERLADLPLDQSFGAVADAIAALPTASDRAAASFAIFGRQSAQLNARISDGSQGIARARREMELLGVAVSRDAARSVERMNDSWTTAKKSMQGFWNDLTIAMAPALQGLADAVTNLTIIARFQAGGGRSAGVRDFAEAWGRSLGTQVRVATSQFALVANLIRDPATAFQETGRWVLGLETAAERAEAASLRAIELRNAIQAQVDALQRQVDTAGMSATQIQRYDLATRHATAAMLEQFDVLARQAERFQAAAQIMGQVVDPIARAQTQFAGLNDMFKLGRISGDQFALASGRIADELSRAANLPELRLPEALLEGSSAAISAINRFELRGAEADPQRRIEAVLQQLRAQSQEQIRIGREMIEAFENGALQQASF